MADGGVRQRLAAILAADVAGYSRLMGHDEPATIATLDEYRSVFRSAIERNSGRVIDMAGDSVLAIFDSASGAIHASVEAQKDLAERNNALPSHRRMQFRIGVNSGDIYEKPDGSIYGDGVNVAARLEGLADPGGILVSEAAYLHVRSKLELEFKDLGERPVKNIAEPIRLFRVESIVAAKARNADPFLELPKKPSIAVLPFDNLSQDPDQEYFADGISEDIITDLSKVSGLFVIARNSAFTFKGKYSKVSEVAAELGVRYLLKGSVRKANNRIRISAQLIDGQSSGHVWAERYDRELDNIFAVQDEVTREIVGALKVRLTAKEQRNLVHRGTENLQAYDAFMRGREFVTAWTATGLSDARPWLEKATELDAEYAAPLAYLAMVAIGGYINQWGERWTEGLEESHELASKAVTTDDNSPHAHYSLGTVLFWKRQLEQSLKEQQRAIELDPNYALAYGSIGMVQVYAGDPAGALASLETAIRLDPLSGLRRSLLASRGAQLFLSG